MIKETPTELEPKTARLVWLGHDAEPAYRTDYLPRCQAANKNGRQCDGIAIDGNACFLTRHRLQVAR